MSATCIGLAEAVMAYEKSYGYRPTVVTMSSAPSHEAEIVAKEHGLEIHVEVLVPEGHIWLGNQEIEDGA